MAIDEKNLADDLARQRASKKAQQALPPETPKTMATGLTTYEDLMSTYRTTIVRTTTGKAFEIRAIAPGDFLLYLGTPMIKALSDSGIDVSEPDTLSQAVADLSTEEAVEIVGKGELIELARQNICSAVISLNFVMKPQAECDKDREETSVTLLSIIDVVDLYTAIVEFSVSGGDVDMMQLFRDKSEAEEAGSDTDTPDSESVQPASIDDSLSADSQS